jgi:hypothetical protein
MSNNVYKGPLGEKFFENLGRDVELLKWALDTKPGDLFNGCDCYNHVIKEKRMNYATVSMETDEDTGELFGPTIDEYISENDLDKHENWVLVEVGFTGTDEMYFACPGGGCAVPPWTAKQVREQGMNCDERGLKL